MTLCTAMLATIALLTSAPTEARTIVITRGGSVGFEPGARTAWHSHPGGQILILTAGTGRVQQWVARSRRSTRETS